MNKLTSIKQIVSQELFELDNIIKESLTSNVSLINDIISHILLSSGKRVRPLLVILSTKAANPDQYNSQTACTMAAAIEFIHTATLLHDDVVDESKLRRGNNTANCLWGNKEAILVGDFLYSKSFELMAKISNPKIFEIISNTTTKIAEGEVIQLENKFNESTTEANYLKIIEYKTAKLFAACSHIGAILQNASKNETKALEQYGHHLGMAFQLIDDALDYTSNANELGKNIGDDLADGKPTLPLISALEKSNEQDKEFIKNSIKSGKLENLDKIQKIIEKTEAIEYTKYITNQHVIKAKESLNHIANSTYKKALIDLIDFVADRKN